VLFRKASSSDLKCSLQPEVDHSTLKVAAALMTPLRHFGTLPPVTAEVRTQGNRNYLGRGYSTTQEPFNTPHVASSRVFKRALCGSTSSSRSHSLWSARPSRAAQTLPVERTVARQRSSRRCSFRRPSSVCRRRRRTAATHPGSCRCHDWEVAVEFSPGCGDGGGS